jgi:hypothetical protein
MILTEDMSHAGGQSGATSSLMALLPKDRAQKCSSTGLQPLHQPVSGYAGGVQQVRTLAPWRKTPP